MLPFRNHYQPALCKFNTENMIIRHFFHSQMQLFDEQLKSVSFLKRGEMKRTLKSSKEGSI